MIGAVRNWDTPMRYGGEEFLVFLDDADAAGALVFADRLRRNIQNHEWFRIEDKLRVTASMGVAVLRARESAASWIRRADVALRKAKATGRNRIVMEDAA